MAERTITLNEADFAAADRLVARGEFGSVGEYVSELIRLDQLDRDGTLKRHEALVVETLERNEPCKEFTQADWDELRERAKRGAATADAQRASA